MYFTKLSKMSDTDYTTVLILLSCALLHFYWRNCREEKAQASRHFDTAWSKHSNAVFSKLSPWEIEQDNPQATTCSQGQSRHDPQKFFQKGPWPGSRDPLNFLALNANAWQRYALSWAPSNFTSVVKCELLYRNYGQLFDVRYIHVMTGDNCSCGRDKACSLAGLARVHCVTS